VGGLNDGAVLVVKLIVVRGRVIEPPEEVCKPAAIRAPPTIAPRMIATTNIAVIGFNGSYMNRFQTILLLLDILFTSL
jgi:hypothetical protein